MSSCATRWSLGCRSLPQSRPWLRRLGLHLRSQRPLTLQHSLPFFPQPRRHSPVHSPHCHPLLLRRLCPHRDPARYPPLPRANSRLPTRRQRRPHTRLLPLQLRTPRAPTLLQPHRVPGLPRGQHRCRPSRRRLRPANSQPLLPAYSQRQSPRLSHQPTLQINAEPS